MLPRILRRITTEAPNRLQRHVRQRRGSNITIAEHQLVVPDSQKANPPTKAVCSIGQCLPVSVTFICMRLAAVKSWS
jgi:hypothetical protein